MSEWKEYRLGDVSLKIGSGATPKGGKDVYLENGDIALIRSQNVYNNRFDKGGLAFISPFHADALSNVEVQLEDILLNITGDSVARVCQVPIEVLPARVNQHVAIVRTDPDTLCPRFLRYYLVAPSMQAFMLQIASSGATRNALTKGMIEDFKVHAPPLPEQKTIARILSSLDDKIELNRRMNETLEAMARAIFKDWFVDFGPTRAKQEGRAAYLPEHLWSLFPEAIDLETGLPMGWENKSIDELFNVSIGRTPPRKESQHFITNGEGKPWLSIKTMGNVQTYVFDTEENLTKDAVETFRVPLVPQGTVMISFKLTVGRIVIAGQDMYTNEAIAHLVHLPSTPISPEYIYCFMKHFNFSQLGSTSSIATAVNSKSIKQIKVSIPRSDLCNEFDKLIKPIFEAIRNNVLESRTLAELRDRLLPKLMSGEIRVKDAEKAIEEVT